MHNITLYQLVDSAFPVGGFVFSSGMESAIKSGLLANINDLETYLETYIDQLLVFDIPFMDATFNGAKDSLHAVFELYEVMLLNPMLVKSSLVLGKNWLNLIIKLTKNKQIETFRNELINCKQGNHFTLVFGCIMSLLKTNLEEARHIYIYSALRDQINALTRLGVVGPTGGQQLLYDLNERVIDQLSSYQTIPYEMAYKVTFRMELAQLNHSFIPVKLFQN